MYFNFKLFPQEATRVKKNNTSTTCSTLLDDDFSETFGLIYSVLLVLVLSLYIHKQFNQYIYHIILLS